MPHRDPEQRKAYMDAYNKKRASERTRYNKAYYMANREKRIARQQAYHAANRDEICAKLRERRAENPEFYRTKSRTWYKRNAPKVLLNSARARARKLKLHFALDEKDIVIPTHCPVLGIPILRGAKFSSPNSPTLDRVDPKGFYVPNNVRVISWRANRLKSNGTAEEFERIAAYIRGEL